MGSVYISIYFLDMDLPIQNDPDSSSLALIVTPSKASCEVKLRAAVSVCICLTVGALKDTTPQKTPQALMTTVSGRARRIIWVAE